jgi:hypothetical protein
VQELTGTWKLKSSYLQQSAFMDTLDRPVAMLAVFIDFKGAHASVRRVRLKNKLQTTGVKRRMLN